jgi:hypothetical protein
MKIKHIETFYQAGDMNIPPHWVVQYYVNNDSFPEAAYFDTLKDAEDFEREIKEEMIMNERMEEIKDRFSQFTGPDGDYPQFVVDGRYLLREVKRLISLETMLNSQINEQERLYRALEARFNGLEKALSEWFADCVDQDIVSASVDEFQYAITSNHATDVEAAIAQARGEGDE